MVFFAPDELLLDFFAGDFLAADELLEDFLAVEELGLFFAVDLVAGDFLAVDFFAVDFVAGDFVAVDFFAVEEPPEDFFAVDELGLFVAVDAFAVDLVAAEEPLPDALPPEDPPETIRFAPAGTGGMVSFGSFLAPETTFFRSAPGVNFGTAVFLALICSPVWGLRTHRAWRTRFSKAPNPVMATFSPRATSRVIVSMTDSSACAAAFRFPS